MLSVENLTVVFNSRNGRTFSVKDLSFQLKKGETLGIVGESGSGKSITCTSLLGLIPCPPGSIEKGRAMFEDTDLLSLTEKELRRVRGKKISMIFQDPMTSLNPYMNIGDQIIESLLVHNKLSRHQAIKQAEISLTEVGIHNANQRLKSFPHEFSGGMQQRVMIAMALVTQPQILIADEPTTALDVTVQAQILQLLADIQTKRQIGIIFVSHDLAVVRKFADKVLVMKHGEVVEQGDPSALFENPKHEYTQALISAIPNSAKNQPRLRRNKKSLLQVKSLQCEFAVKPHFFSKPLHTRAINDVSFQIEHGEIFGLVGESGSGKSTLARCIMNLVEYQSGEIYFNDQLISGLSKTQLKPIRKQIQMIFQNPYASLNPRMSIYSTLYEAINTHNNLNETQIDHRINELLSDVNLPNSARRKYPHEFSGGQQQRIAIARALAVKPELIIADEPVSALDVTIQAQILGLLNELTKKYNLSLLFISHDLSVIRSICDYLAVMKDGKILEQGPCEEILLHPQHPSTQSFLNNQPK